MLMKKDIIIESSVKSLMKEVYKDYLAYIYVEVGSCTFTFHNQVYHAQKGDLITLRRVGLLADFTPSDKFECRIVFLRTQFIDRCAMVSNRGVKDILNLWLNPVIHLSVRQQAACCDDFRNIESRLQYINHHYYEEQLLNAVQAGLLDILDFETQNGIIPETSTLNNDIMARFVRMLNDGEYRTHREVTYFSARLCVTSKYLSEISKRTTGFPANYWINRYTSQAILSKLRDKSMSILQIAEYFNFSSASYFSRYVQKNLGKNPSDLRD